MYTPLLSFLLALTHIITVSYWVLKSGEYQHQMYQVVLKNSKRPETHVE